MAIFQLVYLSRISDGLDEDREISRILDVARMKNPELGITGMLLFRAGVFLQLLEGDERAVKQLYGSISADLRHRNITLLVQQKNEERLFSSWSMGYKKISDQDLVAIADLAPWSDLVEATAAGRKTSNADLMKTFKTFRFSR